MPLICAALQCIGTWEHVQCFVQMQHIVKCIRFLSRLTVQFTVKTQILIVNALITPQSAFFVSNTLSMQIFTITFVVLKKC